MLKLILLSLLLQSKVDLNRASLDELLRSLPLDSTKIVKLYEYIESHGPFQNVYEISTLSFISPEDFLKIKKLVKVVPLVQGRNFSYYAQRVRETAREEQSLRESAYDEWISLLANPININKAEVDELYSIYGVSLIDAVQIVKRAKMLGFRYASHLRRTPGMSYYAYRNLLPFISFRTVKPKDVAGWANLRLAYYSELFQEEQTQVEERLGELGVPDTTSSLWSNLRSAGWTQEDSLWLYEQLSKEKEEADRLTPSLYTKFKINSVFWGKIRWGFSFQRTPYYLDSPDLKYFVGLEKQGIISGLTLKKLIVGHYRLTLNQGLIMDNTDEGRDRLVDRTFGLYGDLSSTKEFALYGAAGELSFHNVDFLGYYSKNKRYGVFSRDGLPVFYYVSDFMPSTFKDAFTEYVKGGEVKFNFPRPLPLGTQLGVSFLRIEYDNPPTANFNELDIPGDKEDMSDPSFTWVADKSKEFWGLNGRTVIYPFSLEWEFATEKNGGKAYIIKSRIQERIYYINLLFRHYDVDYTNPYARPFREDARFEDTPLERSYRVIDPLYAELSYLPLAKPETGFYIETRFQPVRHILLQRSYVDIWRDNTDLLWNYRTQIALEFRPIYPVRVRLYQKYQKRQNRRYLGITTSFLKESSIRTFFLLGGWTSLGIEFRYSQVDLTPKTYYPEAAISGGFLAVSFDRTFSNKFEVKGGFVVWRTNGLSQWNFEDVGIDFLYGDGTKYYLSFLERLSPNLGMRLKLKYKESNYPHTGIWGQGLHLPGGEELFSSFVDISRVYSIQFSLDYSF